MTTSEQFSPDWSSYTQQIQTPHLGTASQPRSPQANQLTLVLLGAGLLVVAIVFYEWRRKQSQMSRQSRQSRQNSAPIDWYQAEFGCSPLAQGDTARSMPDAAQSASTLQPTPDHPDVSAPHHDSEEASPLAQESVPVSFSGSLSDRYSVFISQIMTDTLKGKIRSKDYVYDQLVKQLQPGTGEIFERCLTERVNLIQHQLQTETDELKQAKAERQARALQTLQDAWEKHQQLQQMQITCCDAVSQLINADACDRFSVLLHFLDPNQTYVFNRPHIELLAKELEQVQEPDADPATVTELHNLATGLKQGLSTYTTVEPHLVSWLYENPHKYVGFEAKVGVNNPWNYWVKHVDRPVPQQLFAGQAHNQSALFLAQQQTTLDVSAWVELIVLLRGMQNGLVAWFDKQPYSFQAGHNLAATTFLAFAIIWCELSNGFHNAQQLLESDRQRLSRACFQITLQILRGFAQRDNFPLYGGVFASFSGKSFRDTITYLDQPLKAIEKTQEKARILTLLGYSQQWIGNREQAKPLYEEALDLARQASDQTCEIANLNHLSRLSLSYREFAEAVNYGQHALLLARQKGDPLGETNAIANLGYAEVRQAQRQEHITGVDLEPCIQRLEQGLKLAEKHHDLLSEVFCALGLGIAHLISDQPSTAKADLEKSLETSTRIGNLELEGLSHAAIAEVYYQLNQFSFAVVHAGLGMYLLEQKQAIEWRQVANLVTLLQGRLGADIFQQTLQQQRSQIIARIGVEGFDHLLSLLQHS